jgi:hypothetical protein
MREHIQPSMLLGAQTHALICLPVLEPDHPVNIAILQTYDGSEPLPEVALCSALLMTWLPPSSLSADLRNCCPAGQRLQRHLSVTCVICKLICVNRCLAGVAARVTLRTEGSNKQAV